MTSSEMVDGYQVHEVAVRVFEVRPKACGTRGMDPGRGLDVDGRGGESGAECWVCVAGDGGPEWEKVHFGGNSLTKPLSADAFEAERGCADYRKQQNENRVAPKHLWGADSTNFMSPHRSVSCFPQHLTPSIHRQTNYGWPLRHTENNHFTHQIQ